MTDLTPTRPAAAVSPWRRFAVRLVAMAVLAVLVGAGWTLFRPPASLELLSYGRPVSSAGAVLHAGEQALRSEVRSRHGVLAHDSRCYFEGLGPQPTGRAPQPISDRMLCGPVRFVDDDASRPFLSFSLVSSPAPGDTMRLSLGSFHSDGPVGDPRPALSLVRPDGQRPPATDRLRAPAPPPAVGDVLTTASTLPTPLTAAPAEAVMIGQVSGVRLVEYGTVPSYGWADTARVAPSGSRLVAFATAGVPGESGDQPPDLSVRVDGSLRGPLTATSDYIVTAVPDSAKQVDLVLSDSGVQQSISLLTGKPDGDNPAVTTRTHDRQVLNTARAIRVRLQAKSGAGVVFGTLQVRQVALSFWADDGRSCSGLDQAWLHIGALLKFDGDRQYYGAEAGLLSVVLPEAGTRTVTNAAADPQTGVDDVAAVPASTTTGSIRFSGTITTSRGTMTVLTPLTIPFRIPPG